MSPVRVLVVDDSPTMRGLLKSTLGKEKDIEKELIEAQKKKEVKLGGSTDCKVQ